jgi:hypothetical protein
MRAAYGVSQISFNGTAGTGAGQTIAIVDAYNDPDIISDANSFSSEFGLQPFNVSGGPTLKVLNETGGTSLPANSSPGGWDVEESLDVEWAHSIAPNANIILFEANSNSYSDLLKAVSTAAHYAGVSAVSMSWGGGESSSETGYDSYFLTPSGHQGVTFLAATGDDGTPANYPAFSPNVVAVGGTSLDINSSGTYISETPWDNSTGADGGGISRYESQPSYQTGKVNGTSSTQRTVPDVSMDADPDTGVYVLDSYDGGYFQVGGTSLSTPMWAGLIAIANQGRALDGESSLNGLTQTLPELYNLPSSDFHDVTTGSNGTYSATDGYDLTTGLGTPVANLLVPALAGYSSTQPPSVSGPSALSVNENSTLLFSTSQGDAISLSDSQAGSNADTLTLSVTDGTLALGSTSGLTSVSGNGSPSITVSGTLANLTAALNGLVYTPTSGYNGSDSLKISLTDPGDSLSGASSIALTVNAPSKPTITAPASISVTENTTLVFSTANADAITLADSFAGSSADTLTLTATDGTLTLGSTSGLTSVSGNGSPSVTVSGTLANLNAAVNGLTYTPSASYVGGDSLKISLSDPGDSLTGSGTVGLTVNSPAQPPTVTDPSTASVSENSSVTFSSAKGDAIDVVDVDADGNVERLTLTSTHGTLKLATTSGITVVSGSNRSASMTVSGTLANLNAALNGLTFTPTSRYVGTASITISLKDAGDGLTGSATVGVTVNQVGRAVEVAGTRDVADVPAGSTQTSNAQQNAAGTGATETGANGTGTTVLYVNASSDGIAVDVAASGTNGIVVTPAATFGNGAPSSEQGAGGSDNVHESATPKSPGNSPATPAATQDSSLIDDVLQWLGVTAAMELLNR